MTKVLKYVLERIKNAALSPFYNVIFKYRSFTNMQLLLRKGFEPLTKYVKQFLKSRPEKFSDYFSMGSLLIYRKLFLFAFLLLCIAPFIYFEYIKPPTVVPVSDPNALSGKNEFLFQDPALKGYKGVGRVFKGKQLVYEGDVADGMANGNGILYTLEGKKCYVGSFKNNEFSGKGKLFTPLGQVLYEGEFEANLYQGEGTLYNADKSVKYKGSYVKGLKEGIGKLFTDTENLLLYEGNFVKDQYDGKGVLYDPNTLLTIYEGNFKEDKFQGKGKLYDSDGLLLYEGDFVEDYFEGKGTLYNVNGTVRYLGDFMKGMKHGEGKLYVPEGNQLQYEGTFVLDQYDGNGTLFHTQTGRPIYKGEFKQNQFNGEGTLYTENGAKGYVGNFLNARIDFPAFIGMATNKLKENFATEPELYQYEAGACMHYPQLKANFVLDASVGDKPPSVSAVLVYDNSLPAAPENGDGKTFFDNLGAPVYEGYTAAIIPEMIAIRGLAKQGVIPPSNNVMKDIPEDIQAYIASEKQEVTEATENLYMKSYLYNGLLLNLFYDKKDGLYLFYGIEKE